MTDKGLGWIAVKQDRLKAVLVPHRLGASVIEGWGEVRSAYADMEFAVSGEEVGWQIVAEGQMDAAMADNVVAQLADQRGRSGSRFRPLTTIVDSLWLSDGPLAAPSFNKGTATAHHQEVVLAPGHRGVR